KSRFEDRFDCLSILDLQPEARAIADVICLALQDCDRLEDGLGRIDQGPVMHEVQWREFQKAAQTFLDWIAESKHIGAEADKRLAAVLLDDLAELLGRPAELALADEILDRGERQESPLRLRFEFISKI